MKKSKTVTVTFTLKEAVALYKYLNWATQVRYMSEGGLSCFAKRKATQQWERFNTCAIDRCVYSQPQGGAVKSLSGRAGAKLRYALLGEPVITPCPEGGEIHEYPNALIPEAEAQQL